MNKNNSVMRKKNFSIQKILLIVIGALFLLSIYLGITMNSLLIPISLSILLVGIFVIKITGVYDAKMLIGVAMIIMGLVLLGSGIGSGIQNTTDKKYSSQLGVTIDELLSPNRTSHTGTKYVVYDNQKKWFRYNLLSADYRAENSEEIAAVILMDRTSEVVDHYTSGDDACRIIIHLKMQELATGKIVETDTLYGGDPPKSISKKSLDFGHHEYFGSAPSDEKIRTACHFLINNYLREKERKARVVLLTEDELRTLMQETISQYSDDDGWISINTLISQIQEKMPDFRMDDYPYSAREFLESNPCFEIKERQSTLIWVPSEYYVRLKINETKSSPIS